MKRERKIGEPLVFLALLLGFSSASAQTNQQLDTVLHRLDPETRLEQICDLTAMQLVGKNSRHVPVQAIADATELPRIDGDMISAGGAALRTNHGHWYRLNYICIGSPDHMKVVDFNYSLGERIPKSEWDSDNLW